MIHKTTKEPEVGIFWIYRRKLLKHSVPLSKGMAYGEFINGPVGHYEYWSVVGNRIPEVRDREYDQVPRGRVLYDTRDNTFYVYASTKTIGSCSKKDRIVKAFHLTGETIVFRVDEHYEEVLECPLGGDWDGAG